MQQLAQLIEGVFSSVVSTQRNISSATENHSPMRYSYVLHFPDKLPPFDRDLEDRWCSFLGEFVRPIATQFPDLLFWCSYYDCVAKFRVLSEEPDVHTFILKQLEMWV